MLLPVTAVAYPIAAVLTQFAHGAQPTPLVGLLIEAGVWFQLLNGTPGGHQGMLPAATLVVSAAWMLLALGLGAWGTPTRDARGRYAQ